MADFNTTCGHGDCGVLCDVEIQADRPESEISGLVSKYHLGDQWAPGRAVRDLLKQGWTIPQVADKLGVSTTDVVRPLTSNEHVPTAAYIEAEQRLRRGERLGAIVAATGLRKSQVEWLRKTLGIATTQSQGGGNLYTREQRETVRDLWAQGVSRRDITTRTGVQYFSVYRLTTPGGGRRPAAVHA